MVCASCNGVFSELGANNTCPVCWEPYKPKAIVVPSIPSIADVAVARPDAVPEVPASAAPANPVMACPKCGRDLWPSGIGNGLNCVCEVTPEPKVAKRQPVDFQYHRLNWNFIKLMAQIADYAANKYGSVEQYTDSRLEGEKSPLNHIAEHMRQYIAREPHDKFTDIRFHLAAIAYNAMMEMWYLDHGGPTVKNQLYTRGAE